MDVNSTIKELNETVRKILYDSGAIADLLIADNLKYLTRVERERIFVSLLESASALEDLVKALVKAGRDVRRARIRDDNQLSRMIIGMTQCGLSVGSFEADEPSMSSEDPSVDDNTMPLG